MRPRPPRSKSRSSSPNTNSSADLARAASDRRPNRPHGPTGHGRKADNKAAREAEKEAL
jgi:hypothetical protein